MALGSSDDDTIRASHTGSEILSDSASTVAKTELFAADADHSAVVSAWRATTISGGSVVGWLVLGRCRCRHWHWHNTRGGLCYGSGWLGSRYRYWGGRSTGCEDATGTARDLRCSRGTGCRSTSLGLGRGAAWAGWSACRRASKLATTCTHCVLLGASSTGDFIAEDNFLCTHDRTLARVGVVEVHGEIGGALGWRKVGYEHIREMTKRRSNTSS
jgi:hypothetical protein